MLVEGTEDENTLANELTNDSAIVWGSSVIWPDESFSGPILGRPTFMSDV